MIVFSSKTGGKKCSTSFDFGQDPPPCSTQRIGQKSAQHFWIARHPLLVQKIKPIEVTIFLRRSSLSFYCISNRLIFDAVTSLMRPSLLSVYLLCPCLVWVNLYCVNFWYGYISIESQFSRGTSILCQLINRVIMCQSLTHL